MSMTQIVQNDNYSQSVVNIPPLHQVFDSTANDNDKNWTVPTNEMWKLCFLYIVFVSDGTVESRSLRVEVDDSDGNLLFSIDAGAIQAASLTRRYRFIPGGPSTTDISPLPVGMYLGPGYNLRVYDINNVSAGDDMTVSFQVEKYTV